MRRGEAWWCELDSIRPHRALLLSRDGSYQARRRATVALITTTVRGLPVEVDVTDALRLSMVSVVNVDDLYTVRVDQLRDPIGALDQATMDQVEGALHFALGMRS